MTGECGWKNRPPTLALPYSLNNEPFYAFTLILQLVLLLHVNLGKLRGSKYFILTKKILQLGTKLDLACSRTSLRSAFGF